MVSKDHQTWVNMEELRGQLAARMAMLPLVGTVVIGVWITSRSHAVTVDQVLLLTVTLAVGFGVLGLAKPRPRLARYAAASGLLVALATAMWLVNEPWLPFIGLLIVPINGLLFSGGDVVSAVLLGLLGLWFSRSGGRFYALTPWVLALGFAALASTLMARTVYTALEWAWTMQERADDLLEQARDRQGRLSNALRSLDTANGVLRRTRRELIAARREAEEARAMKEQFAANVSHEFRTPLNLILGFTEVMSVSPEVYGDLDWPPALRQDINQVYRSSRHLREMIDDVLDLSRFEITGFTLNAERAELTPLLKGAADMVADLFRGRPVHLVTEIEENLPALEIDPIRIRQVLLNLLANAARFTEQGQVLLRAERLEGEVLVSVHDTGPGIAEEKLAHLFEEFYQVDRSLRSTHQGTGLGLAISKRFVEAHEGRIWVESAQGTGSTFFFTLPIPNERAPVGHLSWERAPEPAPSQAPLLIAVVDPDPSVAALVRRHLEAFDVVHVAREDALRDAIRERHPHLVVCNVPPGDLANGRSWRPPADAPVPFVACSLPSQAWLAADLAVQACLTKPITAQQLLTAIDDVGTVKDVLVVDDDRGSCRLVERMLNTEGRDIEVRRAYDGESGLRALHEEPPDLLLLDLVMPGVDGFELLEIMQDDPQLHGLPVVLLTATSYAEDALLQRAGQIAIHRLDGLRPVEVLRCLQVVAPVLEPRYDDSMEADPDDRGDLLAAAEAKRVLVGR